MNNSPYPYNLIEVIYDERCEGPYDEDRLKGLEYVLGLLSERERQVLRDRFEDDLSLEDTGRKYNITRERIRQIEAKAIRKLRHPARMKYITQGYAAMSGELRQIVEERYKSTLESLEAEYLAKIAELRDKISLIEDKTQKLSAAKEANEIIDDIGTPLCELELSVRSYNCLARHGVKTLYDICALTRDELQKVRNMGRKSLDEVVNCVHSRGYRLKGEE
jgi:predicted DNA-binding protein YlxM (UPF0122 family)